MIKELLSQKGISAYKLSKEAGLPYSTLNDLIAGKTLIENVTAHTLNVLAKYFELTMDEIYSGNISRDVIYISNEGRNVIVKYKENKLQYLGPKNLVEFKRINDVKSGVLYVETLYKNKMEKIYEEEEYIDLLDFFEEYNIILDKNHFPEVKLLPEVLTKEKIIDKALMVSDYMAFCPSYDSAGNIIITIHNTNRIHLSMKLRLNDHAIISTNMSKNMQNRAILAVKRNEELIEEMIKEGIYA